MVFRQRLDSIHKQIAFPPALAIIEKLFSMGYPTVIAGGSVRDSLLGLPAKDLDIATAAPPDVVERAFPKTLAVGKAFGTIVVLAEGLQFEVTTFRSDGEYKNGRHPESVTFTDMEEDAKRRDFTVNALFYDPLNETVIDFVGGMEDLKHKRLQAVGDAEVRFTEDRLRMLRAVRFVGQLGFQLDESSMTAIQKLHQSLATVSAERVFNELRRLLESRFVNDGLTCLLRSQLYRVCWPELEGFDVQSLARYEAFLGWENIFSAIMLEQNAKPDVRLQGWKAPRESLRRVQEQIQSVKILLRESSTRAERARILGGDLFSEVLVLASGQSEDKKKIEEYISEFLEISGQKGRLPEPFVNGQDLLKAGFEPGAKMGQVLRSLYDAQLEGRIRSKAEALERIADFKV